MELNIELPQKSFPEDHLDEDYYYPVATIRWDFSMFRISIVFREGDAVLKDLCFRNKVKIDQLHQLFEDIANILFRKNLIGFSYVKKKGKFKEKDCKIIYGLMKSDFLTENGSHIDLNIKSKLSNHIDKYIQDLEKIDH